MSDNRKLQGTVHNAEYNSLAASINYEYCKRNKYDFLYYRPYLNDGDTTVLFNCKARSTNELRHASWSKLLSTVLALQLDYDYVVYIDSDCIFKEFNQTLEDYVKPYLEKDIIFLNNKPWGDTMPCAGFYICKVNEYTKRFLHDWYDVNIPQKNTQHAWEQDALWEIYEKYNIGIKDSWMFREEEGQFLRHVATHDSNNRIPYFSTFHTSKNIDYEKNISEIKVVHFNTDTIVFGTP